MNRIIRLAAALVALAAAACGASGDDDNAAPDSVPVGTTEPFAGYTTEPASPALIAGYWEGDYGGMVIRVNAGVLRGSFSKGSVVMTYGEDRVFRGWWCRPGCQPPRNAGEIEFRLPNGPGGKTIDGRWRPGTDGEWHERWELTRSDKSQPSQLLKHFGDPQLFKAHP